MRFRAVLVMTSEPPSNRSGMRFAYRKILMPDLTLRPPILTAASTMKAWPSKTPTEPPYVATISGRISFITPRRRLYSPAGDRCFPSGSGKRTSWSSWCRRRMSCSWRSPGLLRAPDPNSSAIRSARSLDTQSNSFPKNVDRRVYLVAAISRLTSSRSTELGWCLVASGVGGITDVLRSNIVLNEFFSSSPLKSKLNSAYGVMTAICCRYLRILAR
mmetsp:Transcript_2745/g.8219  ORF Transcript_2745/g.8219 Transcript_2745/m.8219 type:complete len:216 (+) Transcript_2745:1260-1907(+)